MFDISDVKSRLQISIRHDFTQRCSKIGCQYRISCPSVRYDPICEFCNSPMGCFGLSHSEANCDITRVDDVSLDMILLKNCRWYEFWGIVRPYDLISRFRDERKKKKGMREEGIREEGVKKKWNSIIPTAARGLHYLSRMHCDLDCRVAYTSPCKHKLQFIAYNANIHIESPKMS